MASVALKELAVEVANLEAAIAAFNSAKLPAKEVPIIDDKPAEQEAFFLAVYSLFDKIDAGKLKESKIPKVVTEVFNTIIDEKDKQAKAMTPPALPAATEPAPGTAAAPAAAQTPPAEKAEKTKKKEGTTVSEEKGKKEKKAAGKAAKAAVPPKAAPKKAEKKGGGEGRMGFFPLVAGMLKEGKTAEQCEAAVLKLFSKKYSDPKVAAKRAHRTVYRIQYLQQKSSAAKRGGKNKK